MPHRIDNIISTVEKHLRVSAEGDTPLALHLNHVRSILEQSKMEDGTVNPAKIHEVMRYIETIKIEKKKGFFGSSNPGTMDELLAQHGEVILPASERRRSTVAFSHVPLLSATHHLVFGPIHRDLFESFLEYLQYPKNQEIQRSMPSAEAVWTFPYPQDETGEIMNQQIGEWQALQMRLSDESPRRAYADFQRNLSIHGMVGKTEKDVDQLLEYLVADSDYTPEQRAAIIRWLQSNGGQNNNRFVDQLISSGIYTDGLPTANLKSKSAEQNWTIENGKIVLHCDITSYGLMIGGVPYTNSDTKKLETLDDVERLSDPKSRFSPMLRMQATIKLEVDAAGQVEPRIVMLNVTSFNQMLSPPEIPDVGRTDNPSPPPG